MQGFVQQCGRSASIFAPGLLVLWVLPHDPFARHDTCKVHTFVPHFAKVPLDKILGPSRDNLAAVRCMVEQEKQFILGRIGTAKQQEQQQQPQEQLAGGDGGAMPAAPAAGQAAAGQAVVQAGAASAPGVGPSSAEAAGLAANADHTAQPPEAGADLAAAAAGAAAAQGAAAATAEVAAPDVAAAPAAATTDAIPSTEAATATAPTPVSAPATTSAPGPAAAPSPGPTELPLAAIASQRVLESLMSPQLRNELQALHHGLYSEPDTDAECGGEATDLED